MEITLQAALVAVVAIVPGAIADTVFRRLIGADWRQSEWSRAIRLVGFSAVGLALYAALSGVFGLPAPSFIFPSVLSTAAKDPSLVQLLAVAYLGQLVFALLSALILVRLLTWLDLLSSSSSHSCAWDYFVRCCVPDHWVVVTLGSGEAYFGRLAYADLSVAQAERDIILLEPALWNSQRAAYIGSEHQALFLPAQAISTITTHYDPDLDKRSLQPDTVVGSSDGSANAEVQ